LGVVWIVAGSLTALASLAGGVVGWMAIGAATSTVERSVDSTRSLLVAYAETRDAVDEVLEETTRSLRDMQTTMAGASLTLTRASVVVNDLGEVVAVDIPASIDSVSSAMPGLVDAARVVDATMGALSILGVDSRADVPLATSLETISDRLHEIPPLLRDQQATIEAVAGDLGAFGSATTSISDDVGVIRAKLARASSVLSGSSTLTADTDAVMADARRAAGRARTWARVVVVVGAVGFALVQSLPVASGVAIVRRAGARGL